MLSKTGAPSRTDGHAASHKIEHTRHWFLFFAALSIATFVELFDSFHKATQHHEISAEIGRVAIAPTLDVFSPRPRNEAARRAITVFYVDRETQTDTRDNGFLAFNTSYVPYARLAVYIHAIAAYHPKVIFLDYVYYREPEPVGPSGRRTGTSDESGGYQALVDEIAAARKSNITVLTGLTSNPTRFREFSPLENQVATRWPRGRHLLDYPLYGDAVLDGHSEQLMPTAAAAIYKTICAAREPQSGRGLVSPFRCDLELAPEESASGKEPPPLLVQWPQYTAGADELYAYQPACRNAPRSAIDAYGRSVAKNLLFNLTDPEHRAPDKCLYISGFSLDRVFTFAPLGKPNVELMKQYVQDKVVMIGDGMSDLVEVPDHGSVPGVFLHAFALQNLLARGEGYIRWPFEWHIGSLTLQVNFVIEWLLTAVEVLIVTQFVRLRLDKVVRRAAWILRIRNLNFKRVSVIAIGLTIGAIVFAAYVIDFFMYSSFHWIPVNPLYVIVLVGGLHILSGQDRFFQWWTGLGVASRIMAVTIPALATALCVLTLWLRYLT